MSRERRPLASRLRSYCRKTLQFLFSNVGVIVLVTGYAILGSFMFQAIEGPNGLERTNTMARERNRTADHMWTNITLALNLFNETELKISISRELLKYQRKVVMAGRRGLAEVHTPHHWTFSSGFLYSLTVITTIGYGNLTPRTSWGKLATIVYTLVGMPLFLLYLSNVGELLARWFKCVYSLMCLCKGCPGFRRRVPVVRIQPPESSPNNGDFEPIRISRGGNIVDRQDYERQPYLRSQSAPYRGPRDQTFSRNLNPNTYYNSYGHIEQINRRHNIEFRQSYRNHDIENGQSYRNQENRRSYRNDLNNSPRRNSSRHKSIRNAKPVNNFNRSYEEIGDIRSRNIEDIRIRQNRMCRNEYVTPQERRQERDEASLDDFSYITYDAQTITVPITVCVFVMVGYILFGSILFGNWENWDPLDGAYFCFISLSSIGFGDFVPGERVYSEKIDTSFIVCSLYLMLGMALVAMCFNLMQEQVIHYCASVKRALARVCRCKR